MTFDKSHLSDLLSEIEKLIKNGKNPDSMWMPLKDVCKYTSLSESTIRRAIKRGTLKTSNNTGRLLFRKNDVDRWIQG